MTANDESSATTGGDRNAQVDTAAQRVRARARRAVPARAPARLVAGVRSVERGEIGAHDRVQYVLPDQQLQRKDGNCMGDSFIDSLDQDGIDSRKWEYDEGDSLVGKVLDVFEGDGDYGPFKGYVVAPEAAYTTEDGGNSDAISEDDPLVWYVNERSAAKRSIPSAGINIGDRLGVKYVGEKPTKVAGQTYKHFNVKVQSASPVE